VILLYSNTFFYFWQYFLKIFKKFFFN